MNPHECYPDETYPGLLMVRPEGRIFPEVLRMVQASPLGARLGHERVIFNLQTAVERYLAGDAGKAGIKLNDGANHPSI